MRWFDPYTTAKTQKIDPIWRPLPWPVRGLYYRAMVFPVIILHNAMTPVEERCILTEELGHHFLSVGNCVGPFYSLHDRILMSKEERRVLRWATDRLIDDRQFARLSKRGQSLEELADHFEVTTRLILAKYEFLRLSQLAV